MGLSDCLNVYGDLTNKKFILYLENGLMIEVTFSNNNLKHLLGLHKLKDLDLLMQDAKIVYRLIKHNKITDDYLTSSIYYKRIEERLTNFYLIPQLLESKIIIDFDPSKIDSYNTNIQKNGTKLKNTKYILYKRIDDSNIKVAHLCLSDNNKKNNSYYPETFFVEHSNMYISSQNSFDINKIDIWDCKKRTKTSIIHNN